MWKTKKSKPTQQDKGIQTDTNNQFPHPCPQRGCHVFLIFFCGTVSSFPSLYDPWCEYFVGTWARFLNVLGCFPAGFPAWPTAKKWGNTCSLRPQLCCLLSQRWCVNGACVSLCPSQFVWVSQHVWTIDWVVVSEFPLCWCNVVVKMVSWS